MAAKYPYLIPLIYLNAIVPGAIAWYVLLKDPRRRHPRLQPGGDGGDGTEGLANA